MLSANHHSKRARCLLHYPVHRRFTIDDDDDQVGTEAPPFSVKDQDGAEVTLKSFKGEKNVVVFFYPKDNTVSFFFYVYIYIRTVNTRSLSYIRLYQ